MHSLRAFSFFLFSSMLACASGAGAEDPVDPPGNPGDPTSSTGGGTASVPGGATPASPGTPSTVPTPFTPARRFAATKATWNAAIPSSPRCSGWDLVDMDGDGKPDLVTATASGWSVQHNTGTAFAAPAAWAAPSRFALLDDLCEALFDLDGDRKPDLVDTCAGAGHWNVWRSTGTGFAASATAWSVPAGTPTTGGGTERLPGTRQRYVRVGSWALLDVDGDERAELVAPKSKSSWQIYRAKNDGFDANASSWFVPQVSYDPKNEYGFGALTGGLWAAIDVDGDHVLDLLVTGKNVGSARVVFTQGAQSYWKAYLGGATGFASAMTQWNVPNGAEYPADYDRYGPVSETFDVDGDGKPDLVQMGRDAVPGADVNDPHWLVYLGFAQAATKWPLPMASVGGQALVAREGNAWTVIDLDGDRRPDLVTVGVNLGVYAGAP